MTRRFRTEPEASLELEEAAQWYEKRRSGLGIEFLEAIDTALEFIVRFPEAGAPVPGVPLSLPVRRVPVRRFPFHVVADSEMVGHLRQNTVEGTEPGCSYAEESLRYGCLRGWI